MSSGFTTPGPMTAVTEVACAAAGRAMLAVAFAHANLRKERRDQTWRPEVALNVVSYVRVTPEKGRN